MNIFLLCIGDDDYVCTEPTRTDGWLAGVVSKFNMLAEAQRPKHAHALSVQAHVLVFSSILESAVVVAAIPRDGQA